MKRFKHTNNSRLIASIALAVAAIMISISSVGAGAQALIEQHPTEKARITARKERVEHFKEVLATEDKDRIEVAMETLHEEADPLVARQMGEAFSALKTDAEFKEVENTLARGWFGDEEYVYSSLYVLIGLAKSKKPKADELLRNAIFETKTKDTFTKSAAIEAIRFANRKDLASIVARTLSPEKGDKVDTKKWKDDAMLPISCYIAAEDLHNDDNTIELMRAIVTSLENNLSERGRWYGIQCCAKLTGYQPIDDIKFWRYWVETNGQKDGEKKEPTVSRTNAQPPTFFELEPAGKRLVYVIDISESMENPWKAPPELIDPAEKDKDPVTGKQKPKETRKDEDGNEIKRPEYKLIETKIELAKAELIYSIQQLDSSYYFNVVLYNKEHSFLFEDESEFYKADKSNRNRFIEAVKELEPVSVTNIHGALLRAFRTTEDGYLEEDDGDPGLNEDALEKGADTIFFLTDGWPTWSDDSTEWSKSSNSGEGAFVNGEMITADIWRTNVFRRVVIHTVGIGNHDKDLLKDLSGQNHGKYRDMKGEK